MKIEKGHLAIPEPECTGKIIRYPAFVDAKADGELGIFFKTTYDGGPGIYGKQKSDKVRRDFPACDQACKYAEKLGVKYLLGELVWGAGNAGDLYKLLSNYDKDILKFIVFDYCKDKSDRNESLLDRKARLAEVIPMDMTKECYLIPTQYATNKEEVDSAFEEFTKLGYEGVVVKNAYGKSMCGRLDWVKIKAKDTCDLEVLNYDKVKERVGVGFSKGFWKGELCGIKVPNSTEEERKNMLGLIVEVEYLQKLFNSNGDLTGLRNPIFKRIRHDKSEPSLR